MRRLATMFGCCLGQSAWIAVRSGRAACLSLCCGLLLSGCAAVPDIAHEPQFHNPFPQLARVAVLPFANQSTEPTLNGLAVANAYRTELQQIPGFEVMPMGVVEQQLRANKTQINEATDFQQLANSLGVDAIVVGSITDFSEYYPPRMGLAVNWYAANPCFHPIPPGYGLPWGRAEEEYIPRPLVNEAEFALAREQLKTQTPQVATNPAASELGDPSSAMPLDWPDSQGFIPPPPCAQRPTCEPQRRPIIEHIRQYDGHDMNFTQRLANYYYFRDDARFGGWQSYLQRKDDFIRFCCYLHITEMLSARGGAGETRVVWRWPIGRYER